MTDQSQSPEQGPQSQGNLIFQAADGTYYRVPMDRLGEFRLSDEDVEQLLRQSQAASTQPAATVNLGGYLPSQPTAFPYAMGASPGIPPMGFAAGMPSAFVRAVPSALVRVVPSALVRVPPVGFGAVVPAPFAPMGFAGSPPAQFAPFSPVQLPGASAAPAIIQSWTQQ